MATYPMLGDYQIVPLADLQSVAARVNRKGDTRLTQTLTSGIGKKAGRQVLVGATDAQGLPTGVVTLYMATGALPASTWAPLNGAAVVTPV